MRDDGDTGSINVLIIEDNPGDRRLIEFTLSQAGEARFSVRSVDRLSEALAALENGRTDAVVMDLSLPDSSGLATVHSFRDRAPNLPIVVMSDLDDNDVALAAVEAGVQDYLPKSIVDEQQLVRSLQFAMRRIRSRY
jgi:two-component system cell cycle response regulator